MSTELPDLLLGKTEKDDDVWVRGVHRARGLLVTGQPGEGKTHMLVANALQDVTAGKSLLYVDPHNSISDFIARMPEKRLQDVVVLSLRPDASPLWPVLDIARHDDEQLIVADFLTQIWRAQYGQESIQARAESVLANALLTIPRKDGISPVELLAVLTEPEYRSEALRAHKLSGEGFALMQYWGRVVQAVQERVFQEWSQAVENKLLPLLHNDWMRRATCGTPAGRGNRTRPVSHLWEPPAGTRISRVTWLRDGRLEVDVEGDPEPWLMEVDDEFDRFLLTKASGGVVCSAGFPRGIAADTTYLTVDTTDRALMLPSEEELAEYGPALDIAVRRRRRRRGWRRLCDYVLEPRGIQVREAIDIADLLDDGRIILVEVPGDRGPQIMKSVATFAMLAAVLRGFRQLALPEDRRVASALYVDEAKLFISAGVEEVLTELRKANVGIVLALQHLGQMGTTGSSTRTAVLNTIGSMVAFAPGREEAGDLAKLLGVKVETVTELGRGSAILAGLSNDWKLDTPVVFHAPPLPEREGENPGPAVRRASERRYYQSIAEADETYAGRVKAIISTVNQGRQTKK